MQSITHNNGFVVDKLYVDDRGRLAKINGIDYANNLIAYSVIEKDGLWYAGYRMFMADAIAKWKTFDKGDKHPSIKASDD